MASDLEYISKRMGVSKSAALTNLSAEPISDLRTLLEDLPENPTQADIIRSRGASAKIVKKRMDSLKRLEGGDDLFPQ